MTGLAFLDTETVCLEPGDDVIWETGLILREQVRASDQEWRWLTRPNVSKLSDWSRPDFEKRFTLPDGWAAAAWGPTSDSKGQGIAMSHQAVATQIAVLLDGRHVVGAVPDFDTSRFQLLFQKWDIPVTWHYHLIDVENLAVGYLAGIREGYSRAHAGNKSNLSREASSPSLQPPWESNELYRQVGINPDQYERHTALGDCRLNRDVYDRILVL